jgi:hypothetical protein
LQTMICEADPMQISTASLLTAQQTRPTTPVQPRTQQAQAAATQAAKESLFEPMLFGTKPEAASPASTPATAQPAQMQAYARPGSQIDIKV